MMGNTVSIALQGIIYPQPKEKVEVEVEVDDDNLSSPMKRENTLPPPTSKENDMRDEELAEDSIYQNITRLREQYERQESEFSNLTETHPLGLCDRGIHKMFRYHMEKCGNAFMLRSVLFGASHDYICMIKKYINELYASLNPGERISWKNSKKLILQIQKTKPLLRLLEEELKNIKRRNDCSVFNNLRIYSIEDHQLLSEMISFTEQFFKFVADDKVNNAQLNSAELKEIQRFKNHIEKWVDSSKNVPVWTADEIRELYEYHFDNFQSDPQKIRNIMSTTCKCYLEIANEKISQATKSKNYYDVTMFAYKLSVLEKLICEERKKPHCRGSAQRALAYDLGQLCKTINQIKNLSWTGNCSQRNENNYNNMYVNRPAPVNIPKTNTCRETCEWF